MLASLYMVLGFVKRFRPALVRQTQISATGGYPATCLVKLTMTRARVRARVAQLEAVFVERL